MNHIGAPVPAQSPPIAIIAHAHTSVSKGGAEIAAATLFQGIRQLGYPVSLIATVPHDRRADVLLGPDEYIIPYYPEQYDHLYHLSAPEVVEDLLGIIGRLGARHLNFHHFLHIGTNALAAAAALPGTRVSLTLHEYLASCHHHGQMITRPGHALCTRASESGCASCFPELGWRRMRVRRAHMLDSFGQVASFISPSRFLADRFVQWGLHEDRIVVIENGLLRIPAARKPDPGRRRGRCVFGYFGQVNPYKGVDVLLSAAEAIGDDPDLARRVEIRIYGNIIGITDAFRAEIDRLSKSLPFLKFVGPYQNERVGELMLECDYVVVPSIWWENSPLVIQEAYATGTPVICADIGGMAEKVRDGISGLHFRARDASSLIEVIRKAAQPAARARLAASIPAPSDSTRMAMEYLPYIYGSGFSQTGCGSEYDPHRMQPSDTLLAARQSDAQKEDSRL